MKRKLQGKYVKTSTVGETVQAFVPAPLPPIPSIEWTHSLRSKFDEALIVLGRLDSISLLLPDTSIFLFMYVRKEAVLSSMIEGTQSSLSDLLLFEMDQIPNVPVNDVKEVSNYVKALHHGLGRIEDGFPISLRLIKEIHSILLEKGRGSKQTPGEFRRSQNWIGGTRPGNALFVPPPADEVLNLMGDLELFLHNKPKSTSTLQKIALSHVQFESIHPFLDGNGRLGRLLITLLLCQEKVLNKPMLYLSLYFKIHRQRYYELLNSVRLNGNWEAWLDFFADAVIHSSEQAIQTAQRLIKLQERDEQKIHRLGRMSQSIIRLYKVFLKNPVATSGFLVEKTGLTPATVNKCLVHLVTIEIVEELTSNKRNRIFQYSDYVNLINEGIETL